MLRLLRLVRPLTSSERQDAPPRGKATLLSALLLGPAFGLGLGLLACTGGDAISSPKGALAGSGADRQQPHDEAAGADPKAAESAADAASENAPDAPSQVSTRHPPPATPADFEATAAPLRCDRALRCGQIPRSQLDECVAAGVDRRSYDFLGVTRGQAKGRYTYDSEAAAACLDLLRDAPCRYDGTVLPHGCLGGAVPSYLRPAIAPGGACERWEECQDGLCAGELGCPGLCEPRTMEIGGACNSNVLCGEELFCDKGSCRRRGDVGESCHSHWNGCRDGLICAGYEPANHNEHWPSRGNPGTCAEPRKRGEPCGGRHNKESCRSDLFCDYSMTAPVCREPLPAGSPCSWLNACAEGLACAGIRLGEGPSVNRSRMLPVDRAGTCTPFGDVGIACDPEAMVTACSGSLRCDPQTRTCTPRPGVGDRCDQEALRCPYGDYCDRRTHTCAPQAAIGERCDPKAAGLVDREGPCFLGTCDRKRRSCRGLCTTKRP